jgi:hypothetical protein
MYILQPWAVGQLEQAGQPTCVGSQLTVSQFKQQGKSCNIDCHVGQFLERQARTQPWPYGSMNQGRKRTNHMCRWAASQASSDGKAG